MSGVTTNAETLAKRKKVIFTRFGGRLDYSLCHAIGENKNASKRLKTPLAGIQFILQSYAKKFKKSLIY